MPEVLLDCPACPACPWQARIRSHDGACAGGWETQYPRAVRRGLRSFAPHRRQRCLPLAHEHISGALVFPHCGVRFGHSACTKNFLASLTVERRPLAGLNEAGPMERMPPMIAFQHCEFGLTEGFAAAETLVEAGIVRSH